MHVRGIIQRASGVVAVHTDYTTGLVEVQLAGGWGVPEWGAVGAQLEEAGYELELPSDGNPLAL